MNQYQDPAISLGERREAERKETQSRLRVILETAGFSGAAENISPAGVFFFSDETVRVTVQLEEHGELRSYPGQLVRVQRMSDSQTGYAIEFDRP